MADEFVWMRQTETGGVQRLPTAAQEAWEHLGWAPCDAPVEPDPAMVEHVPMAVALAEKVKAEAAELPTSDTEEPRTDESEE